MTKTITQDDVLRYIYKETSDEETLAIEKQLLENVSLMEFYTQNKETIRRITNLKLEPSINSLQNILEYSGTFDLESIR